jgi:uncharacterized repeat protein (TIGR03803 family)
MLRINVLSLGLMFLCSSCQVVMMATTCLAQSETVLYSFTGGNDGGVPMSGMVFDSAGYLYGSTNQGGTIGYGTVFQSDVHGHLRTLHSFTNQLDGGRPAPDITRDQDGNLWGVTSYGGNGTCSCGTLFKIDTTGVISILHAFTGKNDGATPEGGVVVDSAGNVYGTTSGAGSAGYGTVFRRDTTGRFSVLHSFTNGADGGIPRGDLFLDSAGNLYGTTSQGSGGLCFYPGCGTVFKISKTGIFKVLYSFSGGSDGGTPLAGVIKDLQGRIYGTTSAGADQTCFAGCGVVYMIDAAGHYSVLHTFGYTSDGGEPVAGLVQDSLGNLYGTSAVGGTGLWGTAFKTDAGGSFVVLHSFTGAEDGGTPYGHLVLDRSGNLYGTTETGSPSFYGTIFVIKPH